MLLIIANNVSAEKYRSILELNINMLLYRKFQNVLVAAHNIIPNT